MLPLVQQSEIVRYTKVLSTLKVVNIATDLDLSYYRLALVRQTQRQCLNNLAIGRAPSATQCMQTSPFHFNFNLRVIYRLIFNGEEVTHGVLMERRLCVYWDDILLWYFGF